MDSDKRMLQRAYVSHQLKLIAPADGVIGDYDFDEQSYHVEKIVGKRVNAHGVTEYLVKWKNFASIHNSWEPIKNFNDVALIRKYNEEEAKRSKSVTLVDVMDSIGASAGDSGETVTGDAVENSVAGSSTGTAVAKVSSTRGAIRPPTRYR